MKKKMTLDTFNDLCGDFLLVNAGTAQVVTAHVEWGGDWSDADHNPAPDEIQIYNGIFLSNEDIENDFP